MFFVFYQGLQRLAYDYHHKLLAVGIHMKNMTTGLYADYAVLIDYNAVSHSLCAPCGYSL